MRWRVTIAKWSFHPDSGYLLTIPFWIRIRGIPLHHLQNETVQSLGNHLGQVEKIELHALDHNSLEYVRARVRILATHPLLVRKTLKFQTGETITVELKCEKLLNACYACKRLTHDVNNCKERRQATTGGSRKEEEKRESKSTRPSPRGEDLRNHLNYKGTEGYKSYADSRRCHSPPKAAYASSSRENSQPSHYSRQGRHYTTKDLQESKRKKEVKERREGTRTHTWKRQPNASYHRKQARNNPDRDMSKESSGELRSVEGPSGSRKRRFEGVESHISKRLKPNTPNKYHDSLSQVDRIAEGSRCKDPNPLSKN